MDKWQEQQYSVDFGEIYDHEEMFPSRDKLYSSTRKQIEYYNQISLNKDLLSPKIDVDIVTGLQ